MFTQKLEMLKCPVCETVVEVLQQCGLELNCCGPAMIPVCENATDARNGSHAVIVDWSGQTVNVRIGLAGHPMDDDHRISWIEVLAGEKSFRRFLDPGQQARASFTVNADSVVVRAYCTAHGLWKSGVIRHAGSIGKASADRACYRAAV